MAVTVTGKNIYSVLATSRSHEVNVALPGEITGLHKIRAPGYFECLGLGKERRGKVAVADGFPCLAALRRKGVQVALMYHQDVASTSGVAYGQTRDSSSMEITLR